MSTVNRGRQPGRLAVLRLLIGLTLAGASPNASAHSASNGYLTLTIPQDDSSSIDGRLELSLVDLDVAIGLDQDGDGRVTWGELKARHTNVATLVAEGLILTAGDHSCPLTIGAQLVDRRADGVYAVTMFQAKCQTALTALQISYRLLAEIDPRHRGLANVNAWGNSHRFVFGPDRPEVTVAQDHTTTWPAFLAEGMWHIWGGADHIVFLITLLLASVLASSTGRDHKPWNFANRHAEQSEAPREPLRSFASTAKEVAHVVTAFTLAHSVSLALVVLGIMDIPARIIEPIIAISIVVAAINNLRPIVPGKAWAVAFIFGFAHGFGFAGALAGLSLSPGQKIMPLIVFNLGVEVGQMAIVAAALPILLACRKWRSTTRFVLPATSLATGSLGVLWVVDRAFDLNFMPW